MPRTITKGSSGLGLIDCEEDRTLRAVHGAAAALDPAVVSAHPGLDLQQDSQHRWIGLGGELALVRVAAGLWIEGIEPNTPVGLLVDVLGPALADHPPMPSLYLRPIDLRGGIGLQGSRA